MASSGLSGKRSGYDGNVSRWQAFLACWGAGLQRSFDAASTAEPGFVALSAEPGFVALSVLSKYTVLRAAPQPDGAAMQLQLQALEARLQLRLPPSYRDFVMAYLPPDYQPHRTATGEELRVGLYAPNQVGTLQSLAPELVALFEQPALAYDAPDSDYFRYGTDQDDVAIRTSYRAASIVVGSHGPAAYDLIVLRPQVLTADAEMEAAMIMHSGEFRAPSFAELMRQLAHMELKGSASVPPYAQSELAGGCGDHLKPQSPWWR